MSDVNSSLTSKPIIRGILNVLEKKLSANLTYHSAEHTRDVLSEVIMFARADKRSAREIELLAIAAAFHDAGFLKGAHENEHLGASLAGDAMHRSGDYTPEEMDLVKSMIMDTKLVETEGGLAQIPTSALVKYLLDADMSNLGREDFFEKAESVRREIGAQDEVEFYEKVLNMIRLHDWHTGIARELRESKKKREYSETGRAGKTAEAQSLNAFQEHSEAAAAALPQSPDKISAC